MLTTAHINTQGKHLCSSYLLLRYPCHGDASRGSGALPAGLREQRAGLHPSIPRASTPVVAERGDTSNQWENVEFRPFRESKPLERLTKYLAQVIKSDPTRQIW